MSGLSIPPMIFVSGIAMSTIAQEAELSHDGLETGGILLGTDNGKRVDVLHAGKPGPNARRGHDYFVRDLDHAQQVADAAWSSDQSQWIGEWHTHPFGSLVPSQTDLSSYRRHLADSELGFEHFISIIVGLRPTSGIMAMAWVIGSANIQPATLVAPSNGPKEDRTADYDANPRKHLTRFLRDVWKLLL